MSCIESKLYYSSLPVVIENRYARGAQVKRLLHLILLTKIKTKEDYKMNNKKKLFVQLIGF